MKIQLEPWAKMPTRGHGKDEGLDLRTPFAVTVPAGGSAVIDTGVHVQIPDNFVGLLVSKSGLNRRFGIVSDGLIDAGYTGTIAAILHNLGDKDVVFEEGDKITQLVILPVYIPRELTVVDEFDKTERGDGGFGSTGR